MYFMHNILMVKMNLLLPMLIEKTGALSWGIWWWVKWLTVRRGAIQRGERRRR